MKRYMQFFLLSIGSCLIQCISFGQDDINKEYAVKFTGYTTRLSKQAGATIDSIASAMKSHPTWNYAIGCCVVCNSRKSAPIWDRVNTIVTRLVEKYGIAGERFVFWNDDRPENCNEIHFRYTDEKVSTDPPPHPNLRKKVTTGLVDPCVPVANY